MLMFLMSAGFWGIGILGLGFIGLVCILRGGEGAAVRRTLGLHLTGVSFLIGIGGSAVGIFKHHRIVGDAEVAEHVSRLASVLGITLSALGLAALVSAVNLFAYAVQTWRAGSDKTP